MTGELNAMSDDEFKAPFVAARTKQILEAIQVNRVGASRLLEPELSALIDSRVASNGKR